MTAPRLYPFKKEVDCPKCGSYNTGWPKHHLRGHRWYASLSFPHIHLCGIGALDHLHYHCGSCGFAMAMACADVRDRAERT